MGVKVGDDVCETETVDDTEARVEPVGVGDPVTDEVTEGVVVNEAVTETDTVTLVVSVGETVPDGDDERLLVPVTLTVPEREGV